MVVKTRNVRAGAPRTGVALAGGGPLGGIYEVGALVALDEALCGLRLTECDAYVGVSAGAFFAAGLANGMTPREMHELFIETDRADDPFEPEVLMKPAFGEYAKRIAMLPPLFASAIANYVRGTNRRSVLESFLRLSQALPGGLFDSKPIRDYLQRLAAAPGHTDDFRDLKRKLYIVATDLDRSELVTFGAEGFDHVRISSAVEASAALPGFFPPVLIDGRYYVDGALQKTLHASAALRDGVRLLFAINPLVPFKADDPHPDVDIKSLAEGGFVTVMSQTIRSLIYSRMKVGMDRYRHEYPEADIVLFEPRRDDAMIFFTNVFSYADRRRLCEHAYQQTRADLRARASRLKPILARHGLSLNEAVLRDTSRTLLPPEDGSRRLGTALQELSDALARLEPALRAADGP
ncbi:patatin-like phospholipase family protein [Rhodomicrobium vannielii ATCC 17100]|uniref:patatin-like phospholipase family protein n=1 Tax=Rhodomicrobium vannielii TaxID=1069 RepID=UPI001918F4E9|nr:patatin-like phospholipase family protein [Rhodomicrobium vannielii]MBJ7532985.1 patatin-like phospholipase family protein [Rhodomicrobium vannielii ATCC 17100]